MLLKGTCQGKLASVNEAFKASVWLVLVRFLLNERRNEPDVASDKAVRRMRKRAFRTELSCVYMDDKVNALANIC